MMENTVYFMPTDEEELSRVSRSLLRHALGFQARIEKGVHGKPFFPEYPDIHFSISHTRGAVVCALSENPVGVDIEESSRPVRSDLAERFFTQAERAYATDSRRFIEIWTRKEALLKRDGFGINVRLSEAETMDHPELATCNIEEFTLSFCGRPSDFRIVRIERDAL